MNDIPLKTVSYLCACCRDVGCSLCKQKEPVYYQVEKGIMDSVMNLLHNACKPKVEFTGVMEDMLREADQIREKNLEEAFRILRRSITAEYKGE